MVVPLFSLVVGIIQEDTMSALLIFITENAALPHGGAQDRVLGKVDLVLFDITGALHGYYSDNTRVCLPLTIAIPLAYTF
jgi:Metallopeptidase family M24